MKHFILSAAFLLASTYSNASEPTFPNLFFSYSFLYDGVCASNNPVQEQWAIEANSREAEFKAIWDSEAPALFSKLFEEFPKGFSRREMTATLSVCPAAPSMSNPLILNVTRFLKSYMGDKPTRPNYVFVDLVFHELLHTWLVENLKRPTPLLIRYKDEPKSVLNHLHLMALQIHVYKLLGRQDLLDWIASQYPRLPGVYPRAWEIVSRIEGYEAFIAEIKGQQ